MAIRVTQHTMYNDMVGSMQKNLSAYMESVQQGSTQKKINRPSDDPAGMYRVLTTRVDMTNTDQYKENVDTALGWLNLADDVLSRQVTTAITGLKTLAEQASTGTYDAGQRRMMAEQARQYFGQLLNLANTQFEDKSIFGGHRYDLNAFEEGLAATTWDENWSAAINNGNVRIEGASDSVALIEFVTDPDNTEKELAEGMKYRWSNDGGDTWNESDTVKLDPDGKGNLILEPTGAGFSITIDQKAMPLKVKGKDSAEKFGAENGTSLYVRPGAFYQGDDKDPPVDLTFMPKTGTTGEATGTFGKNVMVRVDGHKEDDGTMSPVDLSTKGQEFLWSYSTDGGNTWVTAKGMTTGPDADGKNSLRLPIPGGYLDLVGTTLNVGDEVIVHPSRADLDYEIMKDTYLSVNSVGKDVFGGYYEGRPALDGDNNLFEVVGSFIGYLEGNCQEGCQRTLAALRTAEEKVLSEATRIGGMENRLEMATDVLSAQKLDQQERLSYVEDIDLTELLTKLTRQQLTYQTVLQSSSMIMKLSLANYV